MLRTQSVPAAHLGKEKSGSLPGGRARGRIRPVRSLMMLSGGIAVSSTDVLLVVDIQNDFCPGGALAVDDGDGIIPLVNDLQQRFEHVVLAQDWHPKGHQSFASSHPGRRPYDTIELAYGAQVLWPDHCVQGTRGAEFHPDLDTTRARLIVRKGIYPHIDSYSAFRENDRSTSTGLAGFLRELQITRLFICGIATDFCVKWSALDARAAGFDAVVIEDACRAIDIDGSLAVARAEMLEVGAKLIEAAELSQLVEG